MEKEKTTKGMNVDQQSEEYYQTVAF